jgi:predicted RND superfamily exporter protein
MNRLLERFVSFLIEARWPLFGVGLLMAAAGYWPSQQVRFDRSIERMFAPGDPLLGPFQRLKRDFGGNEVVLAVYRDEHLLDPDSSGIRRVGQTSGRMKQVEGVRDVLSLAEVSGLLEQLEKAKSLGGLLSLFGRKKEWTGPAILDPNSPLADRFRELFAGYTHSADGKTAAIVCMLQPQESGAKMSREATIAGLESIVRDLPDGLGPGQLAGEPVMIAEGFSLLEEDGWTLGVWTILLSGLVILLLFRSLRWLIVPLAVVEWSIIVTQAALALSGLALSMVSSMLTAIITVVGVATVMHLIVHVREYRTQGMTQRQALQIAGERLAGPILGAILTDVAGFGALCWASVAPVRDLGTMMVLGSLMVIPATCLLVPVLTLLGARDQTTPRPGWGEVHIGYWLIRSIDALAARPKTVAFVTAALAVMASVGVMRLEVETDFTRNFRRGSRVVQAYEFVETHLGGAGVWDVIVPAPKVLDQDYMTKVRRLEERLRGIGAGDRGQGTGDGGQGTEDRGQRTGDKGQGAGLTKVLSVVDALDAVEVEPGLAALIPSPELRYQAMAAAMPSFMAALRSAPGEGQEGTRLRIMLRARERQSAAEKERLIEEVTRVAREEFPGRESGVRGQESGSEVTGFFVLLTNLIESIIRDQWVTFAAASVGIMALVWIGFRSWKYAVVAMIPNAVPIYMVMGLLGWLGLKMNMGAAMIAAVSMGMSVDSSIHYYAAFRRERRQGKTVHAALVQCQQSVGLAMIFSTVALIVGFGVLVSSQFVPTIYFGALMSLAMLGGMLGNLIVLPLLLIWTEK